MSSEDDTEIQELKPPEVSGDKKKSIRKRLGIPKKKKSSEGKSKKSRSKDRKSRRDQMDRSGSLKGSTELSANSDHLKDDSSTKLIDVNDSIASDAILSSMSSAASIATNSNEMKTKDRVSRDLRRAAKGAIKRVRSLSRSRSSRNKFDSDTESSSDASSDGGSRRPKSTVVTVTSCRSDGYYNQKAPGSTSKLPRKAPTNLKLFHELAVGLKDAFTAVGQTPTKPEMVREVTDDNGDTRTITMSDEEFAGRTILWDFMGNIEFLLALVDEVAVDTATRGALKDDTTFKGLRDVIKKCNKVLEELLLRRERRYTLFFRLPQPLNPRDMERIKAWNEKVERAVGAVTESTNNQESSAAPSDSESDTSSMASASTSSSKGNVISRGISRGRQLLPVAGRVRSRRATPTPRLRNRQQNKDQDKDQSGNAADDGFAAPQAVTQGNLAALQRSFQNSSGGSAPMAIQDSDDNQQPQQPQPQLVEAPMIQPKDELVDVIRGLRLEKIQHRESSIDSDLTALKPDWRPKAEIPSAVPKLPKEYIHRHKLMKQVVSCLLDMNGAGPRDVDDEFPNEHNPIVTSITSRHGDKAGNGKTILAVAAIQTVEVRERFTDGIAWIHLGRGPLTERDIRRLYEELYRQLVVKIPDDNFGDYDYLMDSDDDDDNGGSKIHQSNSEGSSVDGEPKRKRKMTENKRQRLAALAETRQRFQNGDLDSIKEDFARLLSKRKVLICLDDVWRVQDAKWFIFDNHLVNMTTKPKKKKRSHDDDEEYPSRVLMTTRTPSLLGTALVQEVFVRILSETEAVKLLLSTAGRRPYGGKNSTVFHQAKLVVKGCGNSPLAVRVSGSMLRHSARSWNIKSPVWAALIHQCRLNLEEASQLRSFVNAVNRVVDLSFFTISDVHTRIALRRCFVAFAMAFRDNDWIMSGRGVPHSVVLRVFNTIVTSDEASKDLSPSDMLTMLQNLNLMEHARHGVASRALTASKKLSMARKQSRNSSNADGNDSDSDWDDEDETEIHKAQQSWVMHESLKSVAEEMAQRSTSCLSPDVDDFTSFSEKIEEERKISAESSTLWAKPLRFFTQQLSDGEGQKLTGFQDNEPHKIVLSSLLEVGEATSNTKSIVDTLREGQIDVAVIPGGDKMEEYIVSFFPGHLMRCDLYTSAAELLSDPHFIGRRANALGIIEATSRQVADLQELRRLAGNISLTLYRKSKNGAEDVPIKTDVNSVVREGSRIIVEEITRVANRNESKPDSLGMAMCLGAVGEGLTKSRQPRDGMLRLEEAVNMYKELLGSYNIRVADALQVSAKALVKLGESRLALLKFAEAARIYESCGATLHYNSIANAQSLASLLVDIGDMEKAQSMFEEVIAMRKTVYGEHCVQVAKTINAYAILLAKHGQMDVALENYEAAKGTYMNVPTPLIGDPEFEVKCKYDVTLINLNIASIRSKKGDHRDAVACYEEGVAGLREYEIALAELQKDPLRPPETGKNTAHKHLVAALGRIGSLKLKIGDSNGALLAYTNLLEEVKLDSPSASQTEKAKAHIKCATIYRQQDGAESHKLSVTHLQQALDMYKVIFGPDHKDTMAISSSLKQWLAEDEKELPVQ